MAILDLYGENHYDALVRPYATIFAAQKARGATVCLYEARVHRQAQFDRRVAQVGSYLQERNVALDEFIDVMHDEAEKLPADHSRVIYNQDALAGLAHYHGIRLVVYDTDEDETFTIMRDVLHEAKQLPENTSLEDRLKHAHAHLDTAVFDEALNKPAGYTAGVMTKIGEALAEDRFVDMFGAALGRRGDNDEKSAAFIINALGTDDIGFVIGGDAHMSATGGTLHEFLIKAGHATTASTIQTDGEITPIYCSMLERRNPPAAGLAFMAETPR